ncbi:hypothetical protein RA21_04360 [Leisingera sp. ANG-DT]|nr:hypothetical protein RA21_04360 [Leisingera sp. ANG-DT]
MLASAFVLTLPFCAMIKPGLLGNFDTNLSLLPFLLLAPLLFLNGGLLKPVLQRGPEGFFLRCFVIIFFLVSLLTVFHGALLSAQGVQGYGLNPARKAIITSIVPVFLSVLVVFCVAVSQLMTAHRLNRMITAAFWITVGYTLLQIASSQVSNPLYDLLWPLFEGARDNLGLPYIERFGRLNGPTMEPSELAKLMLVFFLPWFAQPLSGGPAWGKLTICLLLGLASLSIIGVGMTVAAVAVMLTRRHVHGRTKVVLFVLLFLALVPLMAAGDILFQRIIDRLANVEYDASAIIRAVYNLTALEIALENPVFGIGWSNEIFYFPERVAKLSFLWEVRENLANGDALTAKSLFLRLLMYLGIPMMLLLLGAILICLFSRGYAGYPYDRSRTRLTFLIFGLSAFMDGGILTSFYIWAAPGFCIGVQMRSAAQRKARLRAAQEEQYAHG